MLKEEWRMHSNLFGNNGFSLFPFFIFLFTFFVSLVLPVFREIFTYAQIALGNALSVSYFLAGMVGAFGLLGREFMNRRFGQASLIAYSSRTLPVSERLIFANFLVKDIVYYFVLYVLPFIAGFSLAVALIPDRKFPFSCYPSPSPPDPFSFLYDRAFPGIFLIYYLCTFRKAADFGFAGWLYSSCSLFPEIWIQKYFIPCQAFLFSCFHQKTSFCSSSVLIIIPLALSLLFLKVDFPSEKKSFPNSFSRLCGEAWFIQVCSFCLKGFP